MFGRREVRDPEARETAREALSLIKLHMHTCDLKDQQRDAVAKEFRDSANLALQAIATNTSAALAEVTRKVNGLSKWIVGLILTVSGSAILGLATVLWWFFTTYIAGHPTGHP